ncbi:hypothetical protein SAMN05444278_101194 [Psychroflexus salarius]|jgi:hypothetical protein|uniref:Uncharacterized protein n=1 Tax=Psychroflexus salarius TaxID=1155689 RepID=A0A1M4SJI2_9FLAO|nr:hypothetical protein [Psychroflexus salarius]SHE32393.1 hypothetical protein SAMN05444278_101194 [Psychroflexus salarius]
MFKKVINYPGFWKSVYTLAIGFCVVYIIVDFVITYDFNFDEFKAARFANFEFIKLIIGGLASGSIYGFIVTYFKFKGKIKEQEKGD